MLILKQKTCKCGKKALPNRRICWNCELAAKRQKREVAMARKQARKATKQAMGALETKKLDKLWSEATKAFYGRKCEVCGSTNNLNSHHVFRRTVRILRWDYRNAIVLCANHHMFDNKFSAHATPTLFTDWIIFKRGKEWHRDLVEKSRKTNTDRKFFKEEMETILRGTVNLN